MRVISAASSGGRKLRCEARGAEGGAEGTSWGVACGGAWGAGGSSWDGAWGAGGVSIAVGAGGGGIGRASRGPTWGGVSIAAGAAWERCEASMYSDGSAMPWGACCTPTKRAMSARGSKALAACAVVRAMSYRPRASSLWSLARWIAASRSIVRRSKSAASYACRAIGARLCHAAWARRRASWVASSLDCAAGVRFCSTLRWSFARCDSRDWSSRIDGAMPSSCRASADHAPWAGAVCSMSCCRWSWRANTVCSCASWPN